MTDVRIEGLRIRIRDVGDGPPVLLLNGLGAPTSWWATLERRTRVSSSVVSSLLLPMSSVRNRLNSEFVTVALSWPLPVTMIASFVTSSPPTAPSSPTLMMSLPEPVLMWTPMA